MLKQRIITIIAICLCCALLVFAGIYFIPTNHTSLNRTMQAAKLDKDGNVIGSAEISMQGSYNTYFLKEDLFDLSVSSIDNISGINFVNSGEKSVVPNIIFDEFYSIIGTAWDTQKDDMVFLTATISLDFEYWVFRVADNENPVYYVAAFGDHTVEEIVQSFKGFAPGYKAS